MIPPPSAGPTLDLDGFLPDRLSDLAGRVERILTALVLAPAGITTAEWRLLVVLARSGPMSANAVRDGSSMDKVQVSRAVARATAAGLVDRRIDTDDRRRSVLSLTDRGRSVHDTVVPRARALEARLLDRLDAADRDRLSATIDRLARRARELDPGAGC